MKRTQLIGVLAAIFVLGTTIAGAQEPFDKKKMASQMRRNQEELRKYSWESKIVFEVNDKTRRVDHYTVRYVMGGMLERMQISSKVEKEPLRRPDGKKLKKKELEAAREFAMGVKKQVDAYLNPLFAEKIVATATVTAADGLYTLRSKDVVMPGDAVEVTFSEGAKLPKTMKVATSNEGSPIGLEIEFGSLDYGPNYSAHSITTSTWQGIKLSIITENSNFEAQRR